jgi:hypothetical protein
VSVYFPGWWLLAALGLLLAWLAGKIWQFWKARR